MPTIRISASVRPWLVLAVVLAADALDLIDSTLTTIAAPTIADDLGGSRTLIPWLGAGYALTLGSLLVVGGRLGDRFGQRRTFLIGAAGFTVASALCGLSFDPVMLVVARFVQGAFGALLIPQGFALLQRSFPRERLGSAFSLFGPVLGICAVGGPLLAGALISADIGGLGWRPMFLINIVIGAVAIIAATFVLPEDGSAPAASSRIDVTGAVLLTGAMLGLLGGVISGTDVGWPIGGPLVAVGALLGVLFVVRQRRAPQPLIIPSLFRNRGFVAGLILGTAFFAAVSGLLYVISLYLQRYLDYPAGLAALLTAPTAVGIVVATTVCFRLIRRLGRRLVSTGLVITLVGASALTAVIASSGDSPAVAVLLPCFLVIGAGLGTCFGTVFDIAIGDIEGDEAGSASGALNAVQQLSNAIGAALVSSIFLAVAAAIDGRVATVAALIAVLATTLGALALVPLLPRRVAGE